MSIVHHITFRAALLLVDRHRRLAEYCVDMLEHWRSRARYHQRAVQHWCDVGERAAKAIDGSLWDRVAVETWKREAEWERSTDERLN